MLRKKSAALAVVSGVTLAALCVSVAPANAFDPVTNSYAVVGSDTLEDAVGALANGFQGVRTTTSISGNIGSFDATGSTFLTTKPYGVRFPRPNGSSDGRKALATQMGASATAFGGGALDGTLSTWTAAINSQVVATADLPSTPIDIVRSSSGGTASATGVFARYTFGRDALAFAFANAVNVNNTGTNVNYIDPATMAAAVQCTPSALATLGLLTDASSTDLLGYIVIPQFGSGTREDFFKKMGNVTDTSFDKGPTTAIGTTGQYNSTGLACLKISQEHDASGLGKGTTTLGANTSRDIMPMSASRWIAMKNGVSVNKAGSATLGSFIAGTASVQQSGSDYLPVVGYYKNSTWGRDTYLFVDSRRVDNTQGNNRYDAVLAALFDAADSTSLTYQGGTSFDYANMTTTPVIGTTPGFSASTSAAVKLKFGFLPSSAPNGGFTRAK
jgi:hypothetical protein